MLDVIRENGEWEPSDALEDYPYDPTEAARADPELLKQEQAAWDEQIEKYHQREAEAFGAHRGAAPGPNDPKNGNAMAGEGDGGSNGEGGQAGAAGGETGQAGAAGSYRPYASSPREPSDETSTAGAQQSALELLRGQQGVAGSSSPPVTEAAANSEATSASRTQARSEAATVVSSDADTQSTDINGLIAVEDLDKLEGADGTVIVVPPPDEKDEEDSRSSPVFPRIVQPFQYGQHPSPGTGFAADPAESS